jgi:hypothetical protein
MGRSGYRNHTYFFYLASAVSSNFSDSWEKNFILVFLTRILRKRGHPGNSLGRRSEKLQLVNFDLTLISLSHFLTTPTYNPKIDQLQLIPSGGDTGPS